MFMYGSDFAKYYRILKVISDNGGLSLNEMCRKVLNHNTSSGSMNKWVGFLVDGGFVTHHVVRHLNHHVPRYVYILTNDGKTLLSIFERFNASTRDLGINTDMVLPEEVETLG